jgi:hypothetical protein
VVDSVRDVVQKSDRSPASGAEVSWFRWQFVAFRRPAGHQSAMRASKLGIWTPNATSATNSTLHSVSVENLGPAAR